MCYGSQGADGRCRSIILAERQCPCSQHDYLWGTCGSWLYSVAVSPHVAGGLCGSLLVCAVLSEEKSAMFLYWSSNIYCKLQDVGTIVLAWPRKVLFCSSLQVMYHIVLFTLVFKNRFLSEKLCGFWGIFMPCKHKIVLIWFFKPHADLSVDDAEVVEILPCLDGTRMGLMVSRRKLF